MKGYKRYIFGEWQERTSPISASEAVSILELAEKRRKEIADYPIDKIWDLLEAVSQKWKNPNYELRKMAEKFLPEETGFSKEMVSLGLKELCWILNPELLQRKMKTELKNISNRDPYHYDYETNTLFSWHPLGIVLHVLAGNVFVGGAGSLIEGLITKNVNILKMSSSEKIFMPYLIESIAQCDKEGVISRSIALVDYSSSQSEVMQEFKKRVDGIVVWGGEKAVNAYRNDLPARTKLIIFGPKLSLAIATKKGLSAYGIAWVAQKLAQEIAIWDQNACTAPQLCYVEEKAAAMRLAETLAKELEALAKILPPGKVETENAVEIRKIRSIFEMAEAKGEGALKESSHDLDWTIVVDKNQTIDPSPLHRTIRLIPFTAQDEVMPHIENLKGYIQTVGLAAGRDEQWQWQKHLSASGVLRIVGLGQMAVGEIDDPHDGAYDLAQFANLLMTRLPNESNNLHPFDTDANAKKDCINQRLRLLIQKAKKSEFYAKRLKGIKIESVDDLAQLPILTREEMEQNIPPKGMGLSTGRLEGGYVSRSGGSTGEPKFCIYDQHDWDAMIEEAVKIFKAMGIRPGDRVANCMLAGDLYGSFVSFDHINHRLGLTTFAFAGSPKPEAFLDAWKKFGINVIEGVPTLMVPMLREVKQMEPSFSLEKILYAGSPMSGSDYDWIQASLKPSRIASVIGANDGGQIAYQCHEMRGALHHAIDDFNYIEIVNEHGQGVRDGQAGRILITSLLKYAFPLIRYEIGDQARIIPQKCDCGSNARILEYLGRADDIVPVGLLNLRYNDLLSALKEFPFSAMQIVVKNNEKGEYLTLKIETETRNKSLQGKIYKALLKEVEALKTALNKGNILKIEIELLEPGGLSRNPRSGKVKNIVDERIENVPLKV